MQVYHRQVGSPEHPRFVVVTDDGFYFTGEDWDGDPRKARIYFNEAEAEAEARLCWEMTPPRRFSIVLEVAVKFRSSFSLQELRDYMNLHSNFFVDDGDCGLPLDDALICICPDLRSLEELD